MACTKVFKNQLVVDSVRISEKIAELQVKATSLRGQIAQIQGEAEKHQLELLELVRQFVVINARAFPEEIVIIMSEGGTYMLADMRRMPPPFETVFFNPDDDKFYEATGELHETTKSQISIQVVIPISDKGMTVCALDKNFIASL